MVDTAVVDGKRQVIIIRRDNVEHLIMTGGPQDLVIESGIAGRRAGAAAAPVCRGAAACASSQPHPADIETPITPDRPVSREAVDRLRDLARPAPLKPRPSLRHTALLRPVDARTRLSPWARRPAAIIPQVPRATQLNPDPMGTGAHPLAAEAGSSEVSAAPTRAKSRPPEPPPARSDSLALVAILLPTAAFAQDISVNFGDNTTLTERAVQLVGLITVLSLAPSILVMVTSFTRIVVVLSLLRTAIGLQTAPPNSVMVSLALFLTFFIMQPTLQASYDQGIAPLIAGKIQMQEAFDKGAAPLHDFMAANVREEDVQLFYDLSNEPPPADADDHPAQDPGAGLHDLRAAPRLRDRLPAVRALRRSSTWWSPRC